MSLCVMSLGLFLYIFNQLSTFYSNYYSTSNNVFWFRWSMQ